MNIHFWSINGASSSHYLALPGVFHLIFQALAWVYAVGTGFQGLYCILCMENPTTIVTLLSSSKRHPFK